MVELKLIDFQVNSSLNELFTIQMYGLDEKRNTYSIFVNDFKPFVYIKVSDNWNKKKTDDFINHFKENDNYTIACSAKENIHSYEWVKKKTLYGFDNGKYYNFVYISCINMSFIYKLKSLYYDKDTQQLNEGYLYERCYTQLYESMIPPLLRFFHIQKISPSGWVKLENTKEKKHKSIRVTHELYCSYKDVIALEKDDPVPYKICSFDIEANSSHGDFPEAIKDYKKVAYDIIYYFKEYVTDDYEENMNEIFENIFGFQETIIIDKCFPKEEYDYNKFKKDLDKLYKKNISTNRQIENKFKKYFQDDNDDYKSKITKIKQSDIITLITSETIDDPTKIIHLMALLDSVFPKLSGDQVTFIGSTFVNYGEEKPYLNHCICLNKTDQVNENQVIESYSREREVLIKWSELIRKEDPDIIIGYNIFGFDYPFMFERAVELNCVEDFMNIGRKDDSPNELFETSIVLASGPFDLKIIPMSGRLQIDLYTYMRKEFNLTSYKLDYVSSYLISDYVTSYENINDTCKIYSKNLKGIEVNSFIHFEIQNHSTESYLDGKKFKILQLNKDSFIIDDNIDIKDKFTWGLAKDDVSPKDIFEMTKKGSKERGVIAKYCIQDCNLVHQIFQKIDVITNFTEMSKLCSVPINFLVLRGQGIKLTSYISKKCREKDTLMPLISKGNINDAYEGAFVLEPKCDLYTDNPVACVDFSSLYPSCECSENISHDSKVWTKEYNLDHTLKKDKRGNSMVTGIRDAEGNFIYDNLDNFEYVDIKYDTFSYRRNTPTSAAVKVITGYKICRYAQFPDNKKAIMPSILEELLSARKSTKKQMSKETDPFMKNILDKRQLSIKVTANSLYGQTGAKTSTFYEMDVAASTTAMGRKLLIYAKEVIEDVYGDRLVETKNHGMVKTNAEYIYGDTDSVFFTFNLKDEEGNRIKDKKALEITIELAKEAGALASQFLKGPHDLEYEKTFMPFCLLSKKRYVGMLYEEDPNKCKRKSMGIVLKRRDNAPIVKDVYGGIIDILMNEKDVGKSIEFLHKMLNDITKQNVLIDKLIITKSLRSFYKNPNQIAHAVLANRIGIREPGNKPSPGDRIPYVYIQTKGKKLQGEKIETPQYIKENNINIDYGFYISNQIMKPVIQIYSLVLYDMPQFRRKKKSFIQELNTLKQNMEDKDKYNEKVQKLKDKEVENILFKQYLRTNQNIKNGNKEITSFFK